LERRHSWVDGIARDLIDTHWSIIKKVRQVGEINVHPSENPVFKLMDMIYTGSEVEWILGKNVHDVIKPLEKVGLDWDDFGLIKLLRRVSTERAEMANPMGWHKDRALKKLDALKTEEWGRDKWGVME